MSNVPNYTEQGGARSVVGGTVDIVAGGTLAIAGANMTATLAAAVAGAAAGYKLARGETALDGSNPTPIATGLGTIVAAAITLKGTVAPGLGTSALSSVTSGGTISAYAWKPTSNADPTLVASTGTETVGWVAIGT
jgi:hypothetical protein